MQKNGSFVSVERYDNQIMFNSDSKIINDLGL